jgi:hypothetical protein
MVSALSFTSTTAALSPALAAVDWTCSVTPAWHGSVTSRGPLEDLVYGHQLPHIGLLPVTDDPAHLYETWIGMGGEGILLKDPASLYRPGERSSAWLKLKPRLTLEVTITGGLSASYDMGRLG